MATLTKKQRSEASKKAAATRKKNAAAAKAAETREKNAAAAKQRQAEGGKGVPEGAGPDEVANPLDETVGTNQPKLSIDAIYDALAAKASVIEDGAADVNHPAVVAQQGLKHFEAHMHQPMFQTILEVAALNAVWVTGVNTATEEHVKEDDVK